MNALRFITSEKMQEWRDAGIKVDVAYCAGPNLYAVRVHPALRSSDLP